MQKRISKSILFMGSTVLVLAVGFCASPVSSYIKGRTAPLDTSILQAESSTQEVANISDAELSQLIRGDMTLDSLAEQSGVIAAESSGSAGEITTSDASEVSSASDAETSQAASSETVSGKDSAEEAAYEGEVRALVQQLYVIKGQAESGLDACISSAKSEYKSLPPEQQTQSRKISICMSKAGQLSALQTSCDKEVNNIVNQMRKVLKDNGQSTALADEALSSYKSQKSARRAELMSQLYH